LSDGENHLTGRSLDHREERLAFFDDVRRELRGAAGADVPRRVDRSDLHQLYKRTR
jgi:hypothetical protein